MVAGALPFVLYIRALKGMLVRYFRFPSTCFSDFSCRPITFITLVHGTVVEMSLMH